MQKPVRRAGVATVAVTMALGVSVAAAGSASGTAAFEFTRVEGDNRYATSAAIADEFGPATTAVLANGEPGSYADALSANYLAGVLDAPILLTRDDETPDEVLTQLDESGVQDIVLVGGPAVISEAQEQALVREGYNVNRVHGQNRFDTNAEVIKAGTNAPESLGLIATGLNFPDALAGGPLAFDGRPLGLSKQDDIDDGVVQALKDAGVTDVLILGGLSAVGAEVQQELESKGIDVEARFAGEDRSHTSALVADYAVKNLEFTDTAVNVASGYTAGYGADALAGGPLSGQQARPLLVTRNVDKPDDDVLTYLKAHADTLTEGNIFGGTAAVSQAAENEMEKAARTEPAPEPVPTGPGTEAPELTGARIVGHVPGDTNPGTYVEYTFDEPIANAGGLEPVASRFHVYTKSAGAHAGTAVTSVSQTGTIVTVRFATVDGAAAESLTVATVDYGAVRELDGNRNPEGDAAIGTRAGGGSTPLAAGVTTGPDLQTVSGFRPVPGENKTAIDFTFDEEAVTTTGSGTEPATGFRIHLLDGTALEGDAPGTTNTTAGGSDEPGGNGTSTITVVFTGSFDAADIARGTVSTDSVKEETDNEGDGVDNNVTQAAHVSNEGRTVDPDLDNVALQPGATSTDADKAVFTFDEVVTTTIDATKLFLYKTDGTIVAGTSATRNPDNTHQVVVTFNATATDRAVGGIVGDGAVTDRGGNASDRDEEGVANSVPVDERIPGLTDAPDLTAVSLATRTAPVVGTVGVDATYTFDEAVNGNPVEANFQLYLADGTVVADPINCTVQSDATKVVCQFTGPSGDVDQALDATLGTVDDDAVTDSGSKANPEGAVRTSKQAPAAG